MRYRELTVPGPTSRVLGQDKKNGAIMMTAPLLNF